MALLTKIWAIKNHMGKKDKIFRLNLVRIAESLKEVKDHFSEINRRLRFHREDFTDEIMENMVLAYKFLDFLVTEEVNIFAKENLHHILELNHLVLCGNDSQTRLQYTQHLTETRARFYTNIKPLRKWYKKHQDSSPLKVAAEIYVGVLSRPQLFYEGNHRTGALMASYILLRERHYPFVLNLDNAVAYFDPSSQIKFSDKRSIKGKLKLPKYEKAFKIFLEDNISGRYVLDG